MDENYLCECGAGQTAHEKLEAGMRVILSGLGEEVAYALDDSTVADTWLNLLARAGPHGAPQAEDPGLGGWVGE